MCCCLIIFIRVCTVVHTRTPRRDDDHCHCPTGVHTAVLAPVLPILCLQHGVRSGRGR